MRWSAITWMLLFALPRARAHAQAGPIYRASWWDAASVGAAGALFVLPTVLELPKGPPSCGSTAPCDPATIPTVDRSALHTFSDGAGTASTALLAGVAGLTARSEEHTSELQSPCNLVCRLLLEKKKKHTRISRSRILIH